VPTAASNIIRSLKIVHGSFFAQFLSLFKVQFVITGRLHSPEFLADLNESGEDDSNQLKKHFVYFWSAVFFSKSTIFKEIERMLNILKGLLHPLGPLGKQFALPDN